MNFDGFSSSVFAIFEVIIWDRSSLVFFEEHLRRKPIGLVGIEREIQ
jgi:hypothetical protein